MIEIPFKELDREALRGLIEEFVTREGTDYGEREIGLAQKVREVMAQLEAGSAVITFDPELESATLVPVGERVSETPK